VQAISAGFYIHEHDAIWAGGEKFLKQQKSLRDAVQSRQTESDATRHP